MSGSTLPSQSEIDVQASTPVLVCFNDAGIRTEAYVRELITIDNATGAVSASVTQYSVDGLIWSVTPPAGTPTIGGCDGTKIISVERFFYPSGAVIPATHVAYWVGDTVENTYGVPGLNATNVFIHALWAIVAGTGVNPLGTDAIDYYSGSSQVALPLNDVITVQAMIDAQMATLGLVIGDVIYAVTNDDQPVVFLSPDAVAALSVPNELHLFVGQTDAIGAYDAKWTWNILAPYTSADVALTTYVSGECIDVELVKGRQADGTETYRWVARDGAGLLVPASTIITGFDETLVLTECPKATIAEFDLVISVPVLLCFDDAGTLTNAYTRDIIIVSSAGVVTSTVTEYSTDGINWSTTAPAGTPSIGGCSTPVVPPAPIVASTTRVSWVGAATQTIPSCRAWTYTVRTGTATVDGASRVAGESFGGDALSYGNQVVLYPASTVVLAAGAVVDAEWTV